MPDTALTVRPLAADEMSLFTTLADPGGPAGAGFGPPGRDFRAVADEGRYRPGWTWVAQAGDGGPVVARAAFWGGPGDPWPLSLDWFDVASGLPADAGVGAGTALLRAALPAMTPPGGRPPDHHLFLPPDWREDPAVRPLVERRVEAAAGAGLEPFVERLRLEWRAPWGTAGSHPPGGSPGGAGPGEALASGLHLRPVGDDAELLGVLERVIAGSLDAYTRRDVERDGVAAAAREQLDGMAWMPAPRQWWRLAVTDDGDVAGLVMPSRNYEAAVVGYVGVTPQHRGRGLAAELVRWATAFLAAQGADRVVADTDTANAPMAAAFAAAGWTVTARRLVLSAPGA